ncbi:MULTISPECIES: DUF5655 domain-containing protein [unclassified Streptomyces]|uniref:DUF5655 domain-containing protein n=1 Tax=unclassified Streptomyces TaxID=2593676 RepID=UPI000569CA28|nr:MULTISPECIES: DUF5655 domain-containing protein [unclassified Streptomyces]MYY04542.1 hypothetical protein [Streptomyces sp. SID4913]
MTSVEWTVEDHLVSKPDTSVAMFWKFVELVERCGPFVYSVSKSTVTFKGVRRGFAGCHPVATGLRVYLDLQRTVEDPRVTRAVGYTKRLYVHHLTLSSADQLDETFAGWVEEAYRVGEGAHLLRQ